MKGGHSIKRTLLSLVSCWLFLAITCFGQSSMVGIGTTDPRQTGTVTTSSSVVVTPVSNYPGVLVTVSGTYTGVTINFEVSDDQGVTWFSQSCTRTDSSTTIETSEAVTNSASRAWTCPLNGATNFRVRSSAYSTGTMNVGITETRSVSAKAGGGGGTSPTAPVFSSAYTNATTTLSNITGLSFSVAANTSYHIECNLVYSVDTNTATPDWAWTGPASPTTVVIGGWMDGATTNSTNNITPVTSFGAASTNATTTTITANNPAKIFLALQNGANAGTVQLQAKANGAGTLTVVAGSSCMRIP